jgi:predicted ATPase
VRDFPSLRDQLYEPAQPAPSIAVMLVGRERERRSIQDLLDRARAGRGSSLILSGEPGIGKTSLLDEAKRAADGMTVLATRGREVEVMLPFSGLLGLLRPVEDRIDVLPPAQRDALAAALAFGPAPTSPTHLAVHAATLNLISDAANDRPVLVVIDDAHTVDASSLEAVVFAALRLDADPVAVLFACREEGPTHWRARASERSESPDSGSTRLPCCWATPWRRPW